MFDLVDVTRQVLSDTFARLFVNIAGFVYVKTKQGVPLPTRDVRSVSQVCVVACCRALLCVAGCVRVLLCVAGFCSVLQSVAGSVYIKDEAEYAAMGWLRLVGSLKSYFFFAKEPYKKDYILQKRPIILRSLQIDCVAGVFCSMLHGVAV